MCMHVSSSGGFRIPEITQALPACLIDSLTAGPQREWFRDPGGNSGN